MKVLIPSMQIDVAEHHLEEKDYLELADALGAAFDAEARERLQRAVNDVLALANINITVSAEPILNYYANAAQKLRELAKDLDQPLTCNGTDLRGIAEEVFDENRASKALTPELFRLKQRLRDAASSFDRAGKAFTATRVMEGKRAGRSIQPGLIYFVIRMAAFAESVKVTPSAYFSSHRDQNPRETPFVRFVHELREAMGDKLPISSSKTSSIVLAALKKRPKNKGLERGRPEKQ